MMYVPIKDTIMSANDYDSTSSEQTASISRTAITALETLSKWIPHWVDQKTPEYKKLKIGLSMKWGEITFITSVIIVILIPFFNYLYDRYLFANFNRIINYIKAPALTRNNFITLNISILRTIIFWTILTAVLSFSETHHDWILISKRLGRVATVLLPTILFLTLRPSPLPKTLYLSLLPIHKWLSRIIVLQGLAHTIIYLAYFQHSATWFKAVKLDNVYGIIAMVAFLVIAITSLPVVRRLNYRIFFINHYVFTWVSVICIYLHARPGVPYITLLNVLILLYQAYHRLRITKKTKVDVIDISRTLALVLIPNNALSFKNGVPGAHIRVEEVSDSKFMNAYKRFIVPLQHPYTLTTLASDNVQKVIIRKSNFKFEKDKRYYISGPFFPFLNFITPRYHNNARSLAYKIKCKRCLIIVGGSAISFALPIMRVLNYNGCIVKIIWVVRDIEDLQVLNYYSNSIINEDSLDIYITGPYTEDTKNAFVNSISEYDNARKRRNLEEQEIILNGEGQISTAPQVSDKTPLLSPHATANYYAASDSNTLTGSSTKLKRSSSASLSHKSSMAEAFFSRDDDDLENVDVDLTDCNYDLPPKRSRALSSSAIDNFNDVSAGFDEEVDMSFNSTLSTSDKADFTSILKLNLGVNVKFGRPKLGAYYYNWCINETCIGPIFDLARGENICCKDVPQQVGESGSGSAVPNNNTRGITDALLNFKKSNGHLIGDDDSDALYLNKHFLANKQKNKGRLNEDVWVIGAGPVGLVNNTQLWANDCGFHFHAESFSLRS